MSVSDYSATKYFFDDTLFDIGLYWGPDVWIEGYGLITFGFDSLDL